MMLEIFIFIWYIFLKVHRWLKRNDDYKANGRDNIEMAFMYSECGNEWTEISSSIEGKLVPKEPLCCTNKVVPKVSPSRHQ